MAAPPARLWLSVAQFVVKNKDGKPGQTVGVKKNGDEEKKS